MPRSLTASLKPRERIIYAYDQHTLNEREAEGLLDIAPHIGMIKFGHQAIYASTKTSTVAQEGITLLSGWPSYGYFLDAKLKDITYTLTQTLRIILSWPTPPRVITIDAAQKKETLVEALRATRGSGTLIAGVSLLTDHNDDDAREIYNEPASSVVLAAAERLLTASREAGVPAGMICGGPDLEALETYGYDEIIKLVPGIQRRSDLAPTDQKRTMSPVEAISAGADYLIVGRTVRNSMNKVAAVHEITRDIAEALRG